MSTASPFIGIDFGTSKCAMAFYDPDRRQAKLIRNAEGEEETPSIVYLGNSEAEIRVGKSAEQMLIDGSVDQRALSVSVKRDLRKGATKILEGGKKYSPEDIVSLLLQKLREDARRLKFHEPVTRAVITFPATFNGLQQDAIKRAATRAGFTEIALLEEPKAAALAYKYEGLKVGECILVYDFGAGTFDIAVLSQMADQKPTWGATPDGFENCGGDDLDRALYDYCDGVAWQNLKRGISLNGDIDLRFLHECRERKENLSRQEEETFSSYLASSNGSVRFVHTLYRTNLEDQIQRYIDQTVNKTLQVLSQAQSNGNRVDTVVLIGGSSKIPLVLKKLSNTLPVQPLEWDESEFAVALGAAYYGAQLWLTTPPDIRISGNDSNRGSFPGIPPYQPPGPVPPGMKGAEPNTTPLKPVPPTISNEPAREPQLQESRPPVYQTQAPAAQIALPKVRVQGKWRWTGWKVIDLIFMFFLVALAISDLLTPSQDQSSFIIGWLVIFILCLIGFIHKPKAKW